MQLRDWQRTIKRRHEPRGATDINKLERWLGAEKVARVAAEFERWQGVPCPLADVPGNVYVAGGGHFIGPITVGDELSAADRVELAVRHYDRLRFRRAASRRQAGAFGSIGAALSAYSGGKGQDLTWQKTGVTANATGSSNDLWTAAGQPAAGAAGGAAPGGTATTSSTTGNLGYKNPSSANTGHHLGGWVNGSALNNVLLIDQLLRVAKTMNSTSTEAVTGTFSRYQNTTAAAADYIGGNFCFPSNPTTVLAATAHNWTVCQYTNQASTTGQSFPSATGRSACVVGGIDLAAGPGSWFMPLASGDVGVKALTQMQCSAAVATGTIDFVVAHQIAMYVCDVANKSCLLDCLTTALSQLRNVYDNACLSWLEIGKPATTATSYSGTSSFAGE